MTKFFNQVLKTEQGKQVVGSVLQELAKIALKGGLGKFNNGKKAKSIIMSLAHLIKNYEPDI